MQFSLSFLTLTWYQHVRSPPTQSAIPHVAFRRPNTFFFFGVHIPPEESTPMSF